MEFNVTKRTFLELIVTDLLPGQRIFFFDMQRFEGCRPEKAPEIADAAIVVSTFVQTMRQYELLTVK